MPSRHKLASAAGTLVLLQLALIALTVSPVAGRSAPADRGRPSSSRPAQQQPSEDPEAVFSHIYSGMQRDILSAARAVVGKANGAGALARQDAEAFEAAVERSAAAAAAGVRGIGGIPQDGRARMLQEVSVFSDEFRGLAAQLRGLVPEGPRSLVLHT